MPYKSHILITVQWIYYNLSLTLHQLLPVKLTWDYRNMINLAVKAVYGPIHASIKTCGMCLILNMWMSSCWAKSTEQLLMSANFGSQESLLTLDVVKPVLLVCIKKRITKQTMSNTTGVLCCRSVIVLLFTQITAERGKSWRISII